MNLRLPRPLGEVNDKDTQFSAFIKESQEIILIFGTILLIAGLFFAYQSFSGGRTGTWRYALCKVFLEQYTQYPTHLEILRVAEKQNSAQISYITTNSYGAQSSETMECFYNITNNRVSMSRVAIDRKNLILRNPVSDNETDQQPIQSYDELMTLWDKQDQSLFAMKYPGITLDSFNTVIPVILSIEDMDLSIPNTMPESIEDLKF